MKKIYQSPESTVVSLEAEGGMMVLTLSSDANTTTGDNFSNRHQGWSSEDWTGTGDEDEE